MTKEEFYQLAFNKPEIKGKSIYKLTIRGYRKDIKGYRKTPAKQEWSYPIYKSEWFFSSKEEAEKAMMNYIETEKGAIHSFLVERITIDTNIEDTEHLEWWSYGAKGNMIMGSLSTSTIPEYDKLKIDNIFLGRSEESYPFKMGQIIEIITDDIVHLEVLNGLPQTIDECWKRYSDRIKRWGLKPEGPYYHCDYFADCMADQFFYLQSDGFDPDVAPYQIMEPRFSIPEQAKGILTARFNRWKDYIDSHPGDDFNRAELEKIVQGN